LYGAQGVAVVFDVTNPDSFSQVDDWMALVRTHGPAGASVVLIGNKCDLTAWREIRREDAEEKARGFDILYFETSAKTGESIEEVFLTLALEMLEKRSIAAVPPAPQKTAEGAKSEVGRWKGFFSRIGKKSETEELSDGDELDDLS
jgi:GTPase SAR1 family protein